MFMSFMSCLVSMGILFWVCPVGSVPSAGNNEIEGQIVKVCKRTGIKVPLSEIKIRVGSSDMMVVPDLEGRFKLKDVPAPNLELIFLYSNGKKKAILKLEKMGYGQAIKLSDISIKGTHVTCKIQSAPTPKAVGAWLESFTY